MCRGSGETKGFCCPWCLCPLSYVLINTEEKGSTTFVKMIYYKQSSCYGEWYTVDINALCMAYD